MKNLTIRLETENDYRTVETLTREAFWNVYKPGADEHYFVHRMRAHKDFLPELAYVLELDGEIIGNIMYSKSLLLDEDGQQKVVLTVGPISVAPQYQRQGLSKLMLEHTFARAVEMGYDTVINFGNPPNYVARGYVSCKKKNVCLGKDIYPTALLVRELISGVLDGKKWQYVQNDADACCEDTAAVEAFDATFPPKEKAWRPSQEEFYIYSYSCVVR